MRRRVPPLAAECDRGKSSSNAECSQKSRKMPPLTAEYGGGRVAPLRSVVRPGFVEKPPLAASATEAEVAPARASSKSVSRTPSRVPLLAASATEARVAPTRSVESFAENRRMPPLAAVYGCRQDSSNANCYQTWLRRRVPPLAACATEAEVASARASHLWPVPRA